MSRFYWHGVITVSELRGAPYPSNNWFPPGCLISITNAAGTAGASYVMLRGAYLPGTAEVAADRWHRDSYGNTNGIGGRNPTSVLPSGIGHITDPRPNNAAGLVDYEASSTVWRYKPYQFGQSLTSEFFRIRAAFGSFAELEWPFDYDFEAPWFATGDSITGLYCRWKSPTKLIVVVSGGQTPRKSEVPEFPFIWDPSRWSLDNGATVLSVANGAEDLSDIPNWGGGSVKAYRTFELTTTPMPLQPAQLDPPYILMGAGTGGPYDASASSLGAYGPPIWIDQIPDSPAPPEAPESGVLQVYALPSVQIEELASSDTGLWGSLINCIPAPGETEVPHRIRGVLTPITLQVFRAEYVIDLSRLRIRLDNDWVMQAGTWNAPFTGATEVLGDAVRALSFTRSTPFESAQEVRVRVYLDGSAPGNVIGDYRFTYLDETRPVLEDVVAEGPSALRAVFVEAMDDSAEDPEHYRLTRVSKIAFEPRVVRVVRETGRALLLETSGPLTFGASYVLQVEGVRDVNDNLIADDGREITFVAHTPPVPDGRRFALWDFVPEMHKRIDRETGELETLIEVLQEPTDVLLYEIDRFATISDPDQAPEDFVDAMLADFACPLDLGDLSLGDKRKVLSLLLGIYQQKGTTEGLIKAARALLELEIAIHPLNEGGWQLGVHELGNEETTWLGPETSFQRFAFEVEVVRMSDAPAMTDVQRARLVELVHALRPAHTHFRRITETVIEVA